MKKLLGLVLVLALIAGLGYYLFVHEGITPRFLVEYRARIDQHVPEDWACTAQSSGAAEVLLFYAPDSRRHIFSVYEKGSLGFAYTRGGSVGMVQSGIYRVPLKQDGACAYLSLNAPGITRVSKPGLEDQALDPLTPFVVILPAPAEDAAFFTADGTPVPVNIQPGSGSGVAEN